MNESRVVFLDRDGVICENMDDYVKSVAEFVWIPGAKQAIRSLVENGYRVIVVTNQSAVGRGIITHAEVNEINSYMLKGIEEAGGEIYKIYYCPHRPEEDCDCRKPKVGLFRRAAEELGIDPAESFVVGDSLSDIEAGYQLGSRTILVKTGQGRDTLLAMDRRPAGPDHVVEDLAEAARLISALNLGKAETPGVAKPPVE